MVVGALQLVAPGSVSAQATPSRPGGTQAAAPSSAAAPQAMRHVFGRVLHPAGKALEPVRNEWVTLHRVGSDTAAPMDSLRTDSDGRFAFAYRPHGSRDAVYFLSASYEGIAYFSQPLAESTVKGAQAEIMVFDTTSRPVPLHVRGRHLVVSAPTAEGWRGVVEVFELANDSSVTLVSRVGIGDRPSWSVDLPTDARQFRVGQGDISADAVTVAAHRAQVFAPFAPGLKQLSFAYELPAAAFPLKRVLPTGATVLEALVEEPGARVEAPKMRQVDPVVVEGRSFARYLAQDVPADAVIRVSVPALIGNQRSFYFALVLAVVGAAMLGALAYAAASRPARE